MSERFILMLRRRAIAVSAVAAFALAAPGLALELRAADVPRDSTRDAQQPPFPLDSWPQFRGPDGQGHAVQTGLAVEWGEKKNVVWKTPIPGNGWSSAVIEGTQIWLTTATKGGRSLRAICLDRGTGEIS